MKHLPLITMAVLLLAAGCGISRQTPEEKKAEEQRTTKAVQQKLETRSFQIDIDYMIPMRGRSRAVSSYSISVDGNNINSYLPYYGVARSVPYGGGNGLNFKAEMDEYTEKPTKDGGREIVIKVTTEEDSFTYHIIIYTNGRADVHVQCRNREDISYRGNVVLDYDDL